MASPPAAAGSNDMRMVDSDGNVPASHVAGSIAHTSQDPNQNAPDTEKDFGRREGETRKEYLQREFSALRPFAIISCSYLLFTITDGAVRMIVLLHAYQLKFTAWEVALMFTLYELAGIATNLVAGACGARWGIKWTLLTGLTLQLGGLGMLFAWQDSWDKTTAIVYVTMAQMLCGIAKDLTKLGGKTVTKLVTPEEKQARLFKLVSFITGMKNSLKGFGYFLGSVTILWSYYFAIGMLCVFILAAMPWALLGLDSRLGRTRKENLTLKSIFHQRYNVGILSLARMFLFGSRDLWFEVPLPFFMRDQLIGFGWPRPAVGAFLAAFIIIYGQVQSWTPQVVLQPLKQSPPNKYGCVLWNFLLIACPAYLGAWCLGSDVFQDHNQHGIVAVVVSGVMVFCVLFAINSSIHSYLIVRYSEGDKVATTVGFYYMSNAVGRLTGTLISGALYSYAGDSKVDGFGLCFITSVGFCVLSTVISIFLRDDEEGLACGGFTLVPSKPSPLPVTTDKAVTGDKAVGLSSESDVKRTIVEASGP